MQVLAVDVGTGTQDILLLDPRSDIENALKMIMPAPTMIVRSRIRAATHRRSAIALTGVMMGGGPGAWAAEDHLRAGFRVYATPAAALTFNDDLNMVAASGVEILSEDEVTRLSDEVQRIELRDFDFPAIRRALMEFGVDIGEHGLAAVAVAVFDHGAAPPEISDRQFRFDYLDRRIRAENRLTAFAYPSDRIPADMTRLQAVAHSAHDVPAPLLVMDTAPAAVLGALFDPHTRELASSGPVVICNIGNFHTIAFRLNQNSSLNNTGDGIEGVFEHHTGLIDAVKLEILLENLAMGTLTHREVFEDHGHGALVYQPSVIPLMEHLIVTGPRRSMLSGSVLKPHFAVPFGDMMVAGCYGLLAAAADHIPQLTDLLQRALNRSENSGRAPWED
jgi:uncharacterized protein (DUF1786 family)